MLVLMKVLFAISIGSPSTNSQKSQFQQKSLHKSKFRVYCFQIVRWLGGIAHTSRCFPRSIVLLPTGSRIARLATHNTLRSSLNGAPIQRSLRDDIRTFWRNIPPCSQPFPKCSLSPTAWYINFNKASKIFIIFANFWSHLDASWHDQLCTSRWEVLKKLDLEDRARERQYHLVENPRRPSKAHAA